MGILRQAIALVAIGCIASFTFAQTGSQEELASWKGKIKVAPVSANDHHSIHAYFNTSPESPDGRWILYFASTTIDGHDGEIRIRERATGKETILARDISCEDAHRAACQQWVSAGKRVVFHNVLKSGEWVVKCVDMDTGKERLLAKGRQLGFGQPLGDLVPIYGPHWNPGDHRGIELLNVATGKIEATALTPELVRKAYPDWVNKTAGEKPFSLFFPLLSPDMNRIIFKIAMPAGGAFRSKLASVRTGLFIYDLKKAKFLHQHDQWGHPAWHPNSRDFINMKGILTDTDNGSVTKIPGYQIFSGDHPSYGPSGKLFTTDTTADREPFTGVKGNWAVVVGDVRTGEKVVVRQFDNSKGARSWRVSHPHPSFSPDGKRLYFNVSDGQWTRLYVAEVASEGTTGEPIKPALKAQPGVLEKLKSLKNNQAMLLGQAIVQGEFNETARKYNLHKTGPLARDFTLKMVWAPERRRALYCGANHGVPHRLNDVWEFDLASLTWVMLYAPDLPRDYTGMGKDFSDVLFKDGILITKRGGPVVIAHTWWGLAYDPVLRSMYFMNTWVTNQKKCVEELGGDISQLYVGPPLWSFTPNTAEWKMHKTAKPYPVPIFGGMLEFIPEHAGCIWHANNWQMQGTWLHDPKSGAWKNLDANKATKDFAKHAAEPEQVGYHDGKRKIVVAHRHKATSHYDVAKNRWEKVIDAAKDADDVPYGHDARAPMYHDPISGDGLLIQFQTNTLWSYNPDARRWTKLTPDGDPMPKGNRRLAYFDQAHGVFVVLDGTTIWAYRYRI